MQKTVKMAQKLPKIQHYLTLNKVFVSYVKQKGLPISTQFGYRIGKRMPNIFKKFSQLNNLPKLKAVKPE